MKKSLVLVLSVCLFPALALADPPDRERGFDPERAERMRAKIMEMRSRALRDHAGLDEATAQQVETLLKGFDAEREKLHRAKQTSRRALKQLLAGDSNDMDAFDAALDRAAATQSAMHALRTKQLATLRANLDAKTAARVLVVLNKMQRKMHRKMGKMRKHRKERRERRRQRRGDRHDAGIID